MAYRLLTEPELSLRVRANLTPEEYSELLALLRPKDGKGFTEVSIPLQGTELKVPTPDASFLTEVNSHLEELPQEERDQLKALIRKANSGKG